MDVDSTNWTQVAAATQDALANGTDELPVSDGYEPLGCLDPDRCGIKMRLCDNCKEAAKVKCLTSGECTTTEKCFPCAARGRRDNVLKDVSRNGKAAKTQVTPAQAAPTPPPAPAPSANGHAHVEAEKKTPLPDPHQEDGFKNYFTEEHEVQKGENTKVVTVKVGLPADLIGQRLVTLTDGWPKRVGQLLFARDGDAPVYLEQTPDLFGWIAGALPKVSTSLNPMTWAGGEDKLAKADFDAYLRQTAEAYEHVNAYPHEPKFPHHYYMHPDLRGGDGKSLAALLARFNPATDVDRDLLLAFYLTLFWGGAPGQRPGFLFTAPAGDPEAGRGVGKTTVVRMASRLCGGHMDAMPGDTMEGLKKRMLSPVGRKLRVVLIDNIKSLKFSWADLEAFVTADLISGHEMYVGEGQLPNIFTVGITVNGATLSKDMAQRCVILEMARPIRTGTWEDETATFIESRRWEIIGDIVAMLRQPGKSLSRFSRWGAWENGVLSRVNNPAACQQVIEARQGEVDDDQDEQDLIREAFEDALRKNGFTPETNVVLIPSQVAAEIVERATGEKRATNKASAFLKTIGITELRKSDRASCRGWIWSGSESTPGSVALPFGELPPKSKPW